MDRNQAIEIAKDPNHQKFQRALNYIYRHHKNKSEVDFYVTALEKPPSHERDLEVQIGYSYIQRLSTLSDPS